MERKCWLERRRERNANVSAEDMAAMESPSGHPGDASQTETDIRRFVAAVMEELRKTLPAAAGVPEEMLFGSKQRSGSVHFADVGKMADKVRLFGNGER